MLLQCTAPLKTCCENTVFPKTIGSEFYYMYHLKIVSHGLSWENKACTVIWTMQDTNIGSQIDHYWLMHSRCFLACLKKLRGKQNLRISRLPLRFGLDNGTKGSTFSGKKFIVTFMMCISLSDTFSVWRIMCDSIRNWRRNGNICNLLPSFVGFQ